MPEGAASSGVREPLLSVQGLVTHFPIIEKGLIRRRVGTVQAVDGVSFDLYPGEVLGLVGESGSGKSTVARTLMLLESATAGHAYYKGKDIFQLRGDDLKRFRREVQMIFQDPYSSLDPRMTVEEVVSEPWKIHRDVVPSKQHRSAVKDLLDRVGLSPKAIDRYPHEFSGGQRQRIGIARALALKPRLLLCDEPVSALDVSVQAQVINLLQDLSEEFGLSYLFIAHDLSIVRHISDRIAVMYLGKIMEIGTDEQIYERPTHPYTQALISAAPEIRFGEEAVAQRILLPGEIPSPIDPPSGCNFRTRCWKAEDRCAHEEPALELRGFDHLNACHFADEHVAT